IYPKEGSLYSDNPLYVLDAPWVDAAQAEAAECFIEFVQLPENQEKVNEFGFRHGNLDVPIDAPNDAEHGVDPDQPHTLREVAEPFIEFVQLPENQEKGNEFGVRPGNLDVPIDAPIAAEHGEEPDQPQILLEVTVSAVLARLLAAWEDQRKPARVLIAIDVSG